MAKEQHAIDITNLPELVRLAEEVRDTHSPRVLRRGNDIIAKIVPVPPLDATLPSRRGRQMSIEADMAALRASAGSWKGLIDAEQFKKDIKEARGI